MCAVCPTKKPGSLGKGEAEDAQARTDQEELARRRRAHAASKPIVCSPVFPIPRTPRASSRTEQKSDVSTPRSSKDEGPTYQGWVADAVARWPPRPCQPTSASSVVMNLDLPVGSISAMSRVRAQTGSPVVVSTLRQPPPVIPRVARLAMSKLQGETDQ